MAANAGVIRRRRDIHLNKLLVAVIVIVSLAFVPSVEASSLTHAWAKAARSCNGSGGDAACERAEALWNRLVASGCRYDASPHSFDPAGWWCRTR